MYILSVNIFHCLTFVNLGSPVFPSDVHTQISIEPTTSRESHPKAVVDSTENVYSGK